MCNILTAIVVFLKPSGLAWNFLDPFGSVSLPRGFQGGLLPRDFLFPYQIIQAVKFCPVSHHNLHLKLASKQMDSHYKCSYCTNSKIRPSTTH